MSKSDTDNIIQKIEEQKIGIRKEKVLLVEGTDDIQAISAFLDKGKPNWENDWLIADARGKKNVLKIMTKRPEWLCVVDKDEWSTDVITEKLCENQNLWILPRFCIENYLIVPSELWTAFPTIQKDKVTGGLPDLENLITADLDKWVAHGVLWSVANPLWSGLRALGFKDDLLNPEISLDNEKIRATLTNWHNFLEPEKILADYQAKLEEVTPLNQDEKLKSWVHGKKFYEDVINPALNDLLGQKAATNRKKAIFRTLELPDDFNELFDKMEF